MIGVDLTKASEQLDILIEKRAKSPRETANAEEMSWQEPTRRRRERMRRANGYEWVAHLRGTAQSHRDQADRLDAKAAKITEQLDAGSDNHA